MPSSHGRMIKFSPSSCSDIPCDGLRRPESPQRVATLTSPLVATPTEDTALSTSAAPPRAARSGEKNTPSRPEGETSNRTIVKPEVARALGISEIHMGGQGRSRAAALARAVAAYLAREEAGLPIN